MRMAASSMARGGAPAPQDAFAPLADGEWGPTASDERHRFVATGVFESPYGIQLSPVVQVASAAPVQPDGRHRPERGRDQQRSLHRSGDRQAGVVQRGTRRPDVRRRPAHDEVLRPRRGGQRKGRRVCRGLQRVQHRQLRRSASRATPGARISGSRPEFVPGIGYPRQLQLGARFLF